MSDASLLERQLRASLEEIQPPAPLAKVVDMHAIARERFDFTPEQRQMIRDTYANGASDSEFQVLLEIAKARRLNPLLRQIHFVKRWDGMKKREVWSAQASIDGMRAVAQRTGLYAGQDEPEFEKSDDGQLVCKVRVYRKDWPRPAVGVAYWNEYVQRTKEGAPTRFWQNMPRVMLSKCAEAIGLRKAFPEDLSGLYAPEEMQQAERVDQETGEVLPRISPHGEADPDKEYRSEDDEDRALLAIQDADTLSDLKDALHSLAWESPEDLENWHPDSRKRISAAYRRRERQLNGDLKAQGRI